MYKVGKVKKTFLSCKEKPFFGLICPQEWRTVAIGFEKVYFDLICSFQFLHLHSNL